MEKEKLEHLNFFGLYTWLGLVTVCLSLYFFRPDLFEPQFIRQFFSENLVSGLFIYFVISTLRGFTLIPSTPIALAFWCSRHCRFGWAISWQFTHRPQLCTTWHATCGLIATFMRIIRNRWLNSADSSRKQN